MNTKWINVLIASALVLSVFAIAPAIAVPAANPVRDMPDSVKPGEDFNVTVTWTAPADNFNAIGLTDYANATASMTVSGNKGWCTPNAEAKTTANNKIEYAWILSSYSNGTSFTAVYSVHVPADAPEGNYTFSGSLLYYIVGTKHTEAITGDSAIMVVRPDLIVTAITPNCGGYLFGNESNNISATVKNNGSGDAGAFNVSLVAGTFSEEVRVATGLIAGNSTTITVTDPTLRNAGDSVSINVTADCNGEVTESNETNNASSIVETVVNNGYKGKRYTGGEDITTWKTFELNGDLLYSLGDSYYLSGGTNWTQYIANWIASDLPVPGTATIKEARLYVPYTWSNNKPGKYGVYPEFNMSFNSGTNVTMENVDGNYTDRKGFSTYNYPYGMLAYNVTGAFNPNGPNNATIFHLRSFPYQVSIRGMVLVVIYADDSEPEREIFVNEGFDLLYGGSSKCTTPAEATAYAPFPGTVDAGNVTTAKLITVAPGADPNEGELIFNGQTWNDVWSSPTAAQIGINERDVTAYLLPTGNEAGFQSSADYMEASNAFLVLQKGIPISGLTGEVNCSIEPDVTVTMYNKTTGNKIAETISDTNGNYALSAPCSGEYWVNASKTGFKNESQEISITGVAYTLNFIGEHGLTPEDPEMPYVLECVNHWQYPPSVECGLTMAKVLEVVNAWLY